ncbi:peptidoglycan-binding domain-containing protein [Sphingomonas sp. PB4P5]|uniref:peptidoglycan-binding domain-containing protein n=1 Tax=Parasphingomonas puruogangriensis TaxID=3096155 RepID=UPI002FC92B9B
MSLRRINAAERHLAFAAFRDSINYDNVYISNLTPRGQVITTAWRTPGICYVILWEAGFSDVVGDPSRKATFIHEMTHVWQGNNGQTPGFFMQQSVVAQLRSGVADVFRTNDFVGAYSNWDEHRSHAYDFNIIDMGKPWRTFNVEQQASIVESWYVGERVRSRRKRDFDTGVYGGNSSRFDVRYAYIRDVIRPRRPNADPRPVMLPNGGDLEVKRMQDKLVALGYLDARYADGSVGRGHSATLDAVEIFQKRHGLHVDRDLGGRTARPVNFWLGQPTS